VVLWEELHVSGKASRGKVPERKAKGMGFRGREMLPVEDGDLAKILLVGIFHLVKSVASHFHCQRCCQALTS
jgi:hypothetical protein